MTQHHLNPESTVRFTLTSLATFERNLTTASRSETQTCSHNEEEAEPSDENEIKRYADFR